MGEARKRTGREAINRIIWDDRLDPSAFMVGYLDRRASEGTREKGLIEWQEGDIPSHRVLYIRCGDLLVWSRGESKDRLSDVDLPSECWAVPLSEG